jgi:hypothetical protein
MTSTIRIGSASSRFPPEILEGIANPNRLRDDALEEEPPIEIKRHEPPRRRRRRRKRPNEIGGNNRHRNNNSELASDDAESVEVEPSAGFLSNEGEDVEEVDEEEADDEDEYDEDYRPMRRRHSGRRNRRRENPSVPPVYVDPERETHERDIRDTVKDYSKFRETTKRDDENMEKLELLHRVEQLERDGYPPSKMMSESTPLDEIRYELYRITREVNREKSVKWLSQTLVTGTRLLEMANAKFDPFGIRLEGFSRNVMVNIDDYKPTLMAIHNQYGTRTSTSSPILQLLMTLIGSLLFHHVTVVSTEEKSERPLSKAGQVISSLAGNNPSGPKTGLSSVMNPFTMMAAASSMSSSKMKGPPSEKDSDSD